MSYRRALLAGWSGRDRLAVLVIAVCAAFLVGSIVVLLAISGQTTAMAQEHGTETAVQLTDAPPTGAAGSDPAAGASTANANGTTVPLATVTVDGSTRTLVGIPSGGTLGVEPPDGVTGRLTGDRATIVGADANRSLAVETQAADGPFPDSWLVTNATIAGDLGADRGLVIEATDSPAPDDGAPVNGALGFFLVGTRQLLALLGVVCIGVAVLVGVVVFSVTRMTVRDRRSTIEVLRATGASRRRIGLLVAGRAALLTVAGVTLGYAIGMIVPNAAATMAVTLGLPVGLPLSVDARTAGLVGIVLLAIVAVGAIAGGLAARSAVRGAPLDAAGNSTAAANDWPGGPSLLSGGAVIPTTATLTVFVAFALVVVALAGVVGGIGAAGAQSSGAIVEPDAVHPVDSQVPATYADQLEASGATASPEILLFLVHDGQAVPARGVDFESYRSVTDAAVVAGRSPNATDEAVIGTDLADTIGVDPGDELALGGSTTDAVGTVEVVGTYEADGVADDHLLVSLPLARHLADVPPGQANLVRYDRAPAGIANDSVVAVGLSAPQQAALGETVPVELRVRNVGSTASSRTITARFGDDTRRTSITLDAGEQQTVEFSFRAGDAGTRTVRVASLTWSVDVVAPETLTLAPLPERGPPNASLGVAVRSVGGDAVESAAISIGDKSAATDASGEARVRLPTEPGTYTIRATAGNRSATHEIRVDPDATRDAAVRLVTPERTSVFTAPTATLRIANPWQTPLDRTVTIDAPGVDSTESVQLDPGADRTITHTLDRRPPGRYGVSATVTAAGAGVEQSVDRELTAGYVVTGDDRLASAIASSGAVEGGTAGGDVVSRAFGNVWLVLGTLVVLGALMTVGSTIAAFADAVQARRGDVGVHRAVGASPIQIARLVLGDALRICVPAVLASVGLAIVALHLLARLGVLTVFGVSVSPSASPAIVLGLAACALGLALAGAGVVAWRYTSVDPSRLLGGEA